MLNGGLLMKKETLSEQVRAARGNRSVREYARESGVDASIISRIENGSYTPGVKIIKRLTSPEAKPQGKITYEGLIEAADGDAKYKKGVKSGLAAAVSGLSGLATCNVGANSPEEYGDYFAWGETESKDDYSWANYKYCNGNANSMTKYCLELNHGMVDDKEVLDLEDDAARVN